MPKELLPWVSSSKLRNIEADLFCLYLCP